MDTAGAWLTDLNREQVRKGHPVQMCQQKEHTCAIQFTVLLDEYVRDIKAKSSFTVLKQLPWEYEKYA